MHISLYSLRNQKQLLATPECITATAVSSAGTQYLEMSSFQIFQDTETGP